MSGVLHGALLAGGVLLGVPVLVFWIECVAALWPRRGRLPELASRPRLAVLIPAHDEEGAIGETVRAARSQLAGEDRLLVVADNCSDRTAERAREAGAEVAERRDPERRGKGFALAFGLDRLKVDPPEVVLFLDADTRVEEGAVEALRQTAAAAGRPAQAIYVLEPPPGSRIRDVVSSFAFTVKNCVRPLGLARLGLPCMLTGSGMAIPWGRVDLSRLASANIVEDMQLGIDLALAGHPPLLCAEARVLGTLPAGERAARVQRTRWEHGHLRTILTQAPRLAWAGLRRIRPGLLAMSFDLSVPPLALLCLIWAALAAGAAALALADGGRWVPAAVLGSEGFLIGVAVLAAWARHARGKVPLHALLLAPFYVLWKVPLYVAFLFRKQSEWVRTPREEERASTGESGR